MKTSYLVAIAALAAPSSVLAAPHRITVPAHVEYCVVSRPIDASHYGIPEVREALFQNLSIQIEQAALSAGLSSVGVAFVDTVMPGSIGPSSNASEASYTVRECVVVPTSGSPPLVAPGLRRVAEKTLTAAICPSAAIDSCKQELENAIRQENKSPADATRPIIWRTRPALRVDDSVDNLVMSMSDATLRKLQDSAPSVKAQDSFVILSGELTVAGN